MKKLMMLAISQLLFCSVLFAQTDNPGCTLHVICKDSDCQVQSTCTNVTNCPYATFTVVEGCPTNLSIKAHTTCGLLSQCPHCASCVTIFTAGGAFVTSLTSEAACNAGNCCAVTNWNFALGRYVMYVCLVPCNEVDGTACCGAGVGCAAWGEVSQGTLFCP